MEVLVKAKIQDNPDVSNLRWWGWSTLHLILTTPPKCSCHVAYFHASGHQFWYDLCGRTTEDIELVLQLAENRLFRTQSSQRNQECDSHKFLSSGTWPEQGNDQRHRRHDESCSVSSVFHWFCAKRTIECQIRESKFNTMLTVEERSRSFKIGRDKKCGGNQICYIYLGENVFPWSLAQSVEVIQVDSQLGKIVFMRKLSLRLYITPRFESGESTFNLLIKIKILLERKEMSLRKQAKVHRGPLVDSMHK